MHATPSVVFLCAADGDVRLITLWYALTHALHTHTAHTPGTPGRSWTTEGAAGDGLYIFLVSIQRNRNRAIMLYSSTHQETQGEIALAVNDLKMRPLLIVPPALFALASVPGTPRVMLSSPIISRHPPPLCSETMQKPEQTTLPPNNDGDEDDGEEDGWALELPGAAFLAKNIDRPQSELFNAACVASALLLFAVQTLELSPEVQVLLKKVEQTIALGFGIEYLARWYSTNLNPRHIVKPMILLDLLSFFPTLLQLMLPIAAGVALDKLGMSNDPQLVVLYGKVYYGLAAWAGADFVFLRLVRLVRLQRFLRDNESFSRLQLQLGMEPRSIKPWQLQLVRALSSIFALLIVASGCIYEAEPQIPDYFTALYYGVQVLTNGNDAIVPATTEGRFAVTGSILAGIAIIPLQVSKLAQAYFQREEDACVIPAGDLDEAYCLFPESEPAAKQPAPGRQLSQAEADMIAARVHALLEERKLL